MTVLARIGIFVLKVVVVTAITFALDFAIRFVYHFVRGLRRKQETTEVSA